MTKAPEKELPVIFRSFSNGRGKGRTVEAFFPTLPGTAAYDFTCYATIGQHSSASREYMYTGRLATPYEYASLLAELCDIYEDGETILQPVERITSDMNAARLAEYDRGHK